MVNYTIIYCLILYNKFQIGFVKNGIKRIVHIKNKKIKRREKLLSRHCVDSDFAHNHRVLYNLTFIQYRGVNYPSSITSLSNTPFDVRLLIVILVT
jgi:hypothetical protein